MPEKQIYHPGLKTFRVIYGGDQASVELMAKFQMDLWEERWRKIQLARAKREKDEELAKRNSLQKELALQRTREAENQLDALSNILRDGIEIDHTFDWETLKNRAPFSEPEPKPREKLPTSPAPLPGSQDFAPNLTFMDKVLPGRRSRKLPEAEGRYLQAKAAWATRDKKILEMNARHQAQFEKELKGWISRKTLYALTLAVQHAEVDAQKRAYEARQRNGFVDYWSNVLFASEHSEGFPKSFAIDYLPETETVVVEYELPDIECIPRLKELKYIATRNEFREVRVSDAWLDRTYDSVLYQICLRTVYEIIQSDIADAASSVAFNGWVNYIDKSTGQDVRACVLSLQVTKEEFSQLNLAQVDPKACFRNLKGVSGSKLASRSVVRPILQLNRKDKRFVASHDVAYELDDSFKLAAMDWLDFKNLIREIFEKEFRSNGGEVKITRASRDGGVDAIAFDPDPIRGGKIVIQAKRYTNTVGVSAVRDLFGTVHNEGATKGILVTTSVYGPDAYEFAKGKPLTLLNGSELLYLLHKHGHRARIDLAEAKRLEAER